MRGAMLPQTWVVCGWPERESTNSWKRMSASTQRSRSSVAGRLAHQPDLLRELAEVGLGHPLERLREAEPLEREPDRDQDLAAPPRRRPRARRRRDRGRRRRGPRARAGGAPRAPGPGSCSARARSGPRSGARRPRSCPTTIASRSASSTRSRASCAARRSAAGRLVSAPAGCANDIVDNSGDG